MEQIPMEDTTAKSSKGTVIAVVAALIAAAAAGGGMYVYQKNENNKDQKYLQERVDALREQLADAQRATPSPTVTPQSTATPVVTVSPTTAANLKTYTNSTFGFSLRYPLDWKVIGDTIQKDTKAESKPGEALTVGVSTTESAYVGVIVNHGGFDPVVAKVSFDATYQNGKLSLSTGHVLQSDVYQPAEGTYSTEFSAGGNAYSIWGAHLTEKQFTDVVSTFSL